MVFGFCCLFKGIWQLGIITIRMAKFLCNHPWVLHKLFLLPSWVPLGDPWGSLRIRPRSPPNDRAKKHLFSYVLSIPLRSEAFLQPPWLNMAIFKVVVPSWVHLGANLGRLGRVLRRLVAVWGRHVASKPTKRQSKR